jgi:hypothetical protein
MHRSFFFLDTRLPTLVTHERYALFGYEWHISAVCDGITDI